VATDGSVAVGVVNVLHLIAAPSGQVFGSFNQLGGRIDFNPTLSTVHCYTRALQRTFKKPHRLLLFFSLKYSTRLLR